MAGTAPHTDQLGIRLGQRAAIWLAAGVAGVAAVIVLDIAGAAPAIDTWLRARLGDAAGDTVGFAVMWSVIGLAGGAVGGALEGRSLDRASPVRPQHR